MTVTEINDFLSEFLAPTRGGESASLNELLAYHERKADLLSRIAAEQDTIHAHATAARAREQLIELRTPAHHAEQADEAEAGDA